MTTTKLTWAQARGFTDTMEADEVSTLLFRMGMEKMQAMTEGELEAIQGEPERLGQSIVDMWAKFTSLLRDPEADPGEIMRAQMDAQEAQFAMTIWPLTEEDFA